MSAGQLEMACTLTAQRLSLLNELSGPQFFDKALFRGFIHKLRERRVVWTDAAGRLDYDRALEDIVRDARVILSREVRHSILKITPGGNVPDAGGPPSTPNVVPAAPAGLAPTDSATDALYPEQAHPRD
jgi:glycerol-3-phosphate O-acyltransferase